ncbi:MAG: hypothetical protein Q9M50_09060 [Methylococcales bacterium]|nr:hypothetical protein [Methylococcales bacterium]
MEKLITENIVEWFYECRGSQYGYLLLNSEDSNLIQLVKDKLITSGVICFKHNRSFKLASNDRQYKVYLTIAKELGGSLNFGELKRIIKDNFPNFHFDADPTEIRRYFNYMQESIALKEEKIKELNEGLSEQDEELKNLNKELSILTHNYKKQHKKLETEYNKALRKIKEKNSNGSWDEIIRLVLLNKIY